MLSRQFDHGDPASALTELHNFGAPNGTPYAAYYRAFQLVVSGVTGNERALAPGLGAGTGECASKRKRAVSAAHA